MPAIQIPADQSNTFIAKLSIYMFTVMPNPKTPINILTNGDNINLGPMTKPKLLINVIAEEYIANAGDTNSCAKIELPPIAS